MIYSLIISFISFKYINFYIKKEENLVYSKKWLFILFVFNLISFYINILTNNNLLGILLSILVSILIAISMIDYKIYIIPDLLNIFLFLIIILINFVFKYRYYNNFVDLLIGIGFVFLILVITIVYLLVYKKEILGFGDIKFLFATSFILGILYCSILLVIASIFAIIIEMLILKSKRKVIPFGPYLSFALILIIMYFNIIEIIS